MPERKPSAAQAKRLLADLAALRQGKPSEVCTLVKAITGEIRQRRGQLNAVKLGTAVTALAFRLQDDSEPLPVDALEAFDTDELRRLALQGFLLSVELAIDP